MILKMSLATHTVFEAGELLGPLTKMPTKSDITLFAEIFTKTPLWNLSGNKMKMRLIVPFEG